MKFKPISKLQSLKRSTFPFCRALTVRSLALSVPIRSRSLFKKRSLCVNRSFSGHSSFSPFSFIFKRNSKMKEWVFTSHSKMRKEPVHKRGRKLNIQCITHKKN